MEVKTVLITGSTRGIGFGLAKEFLLLGHQVIINGTSDESLSSALKKLDGFSPNIIGLAGDVSNATTYENLISLAIQNFGKIDIWINNAGIPQSHKLIFELENQEIQNVISTNLVGLLIGTKAAINFFKKQGFGKLFNMEGFGSTGRMMEKLTLYGTSKRAVNYFTKSVSLEHKTENFQIGSLSPGMVRTDFLKKAINSFTPEEQKRNTKVFQILAEDPEIVTHVLVKKILRSTKQYDRINYLSPGRLIPKLIKLIFVK